MVATQEHKQHRATIRAAKPSTPSHELPHDDSKNFREPPEEFVEFTNDLMAPREPRDCREPPDEPPDDANEPEEPDEEAEEADEPCVFVIPRSLFHEAHLCASNFCWADLMMFVASSHTSIPPDAFFW
jgi:hypothetical protein